MPTMPSGAPFRLVLQAALLLAILTTAPVAQAQYQKRELAVSAGIGRQYPTGAFEDLAKPGQHVTLDGSYFVNPSWSLGLRLGYVNFDASSHAADLIDVDYLSADFAAHLMLYPESWFTPYILGGAGVYVERSERLAGAARRTVNVARPGFTGGFGLSAHRETSPYSLYTEVTYHHIPSSLGSRQYVCWTLGARLSFGGRPF